MSTEKSMNTAKPQSGQQVRETPRRPRLDRRTSARLAAAEYDRFADALAELAPEDWAKPTDCPDWDVRQVACHTVGMAAMAAGIREQLRQQRVAAAEAAAAGVPFLDALTALQVRERAGWTPQRVLAEMRSIGPRGARARRRVPSLLRRRAIPQKQLVADREETWTLAFLVDTILTRDPWMHRMDIARATGRSPVLTADHDGTIVGDVVGEWAERHGRPYRLRLTGAAGGDWTAGEGGQVIEMDAVDFCRVVSGRGSGGGLLLAEVPF
ncbi:TIGR03083 family protein [Nocardioides terrae]|uniref:TIGR03083 family protein n=1 Tax=Nocardioides terrae TaxID=574651 RepID=A0A1I1DK64_9ACTN|nr:maleylpyruvate isomerase family mycothiol-dependent enzyme [Nocardioides terrae]SFB72903.1 TIGR03083 family protein [Nocardioides terrae]